MIQEALPARHDHHLLAHSLAEPGGVRHLPVARGAARRPARQQHPRVSHAVSLQQFRRHGRSPARGAGRPGDVHRVVPRQADRGQALSDLGRVAALARRWSASPVEQCRRDVRRAPRACRRTTRSASASTASTTRKGIEERFRAVERLLELQPEWVGRFTFIQIARADAHPHRAVPGVRGAGARDGGAHQRAVRRRGPPADRAQGRASRTGATSTSTTAPPSCASSAACTTG